MGINTERFINTYKDFYYDDWANQKTSGERKLLGVPNNLKAANRNAEQWVENEPLYMGIFDKYALAWKSGKLTWNASNCRNGVCFKDSFEKGNSYINGYGGRIKKSSFNQYCKEIEQLRIHSSNYGLNDFKKLYETLVEISPENIGPVYIITSLFFESKGAFPIYDKFAHIAAKSLALGISPSEVYLGGNPEKTNAEAVSNLYNEYLILLKILFPDAISIQPYIPRDLDRALWVYGHCSNRWPVDKADK